MTMLKNYLPKPLLPICDIFFRKLIFNEMLKFFIENEQISPNQLGFKRVDSYINQLLAITHEISKLFYEIYFRKLIFNEMLKFFIENEWMSPNQSGFKPVDSCINQLLAITREIYKLFHKGSEIHLFF